MKLSPREIEKLELHNAGYLAQKRLARGLKLNYTEAVALIASQVCFCCVNFQSWKQFFFEFEDSKIGNVLRNQFNVNCMQKQCFYPLEKISN